MSHWSHDFLRHVFMICTHHPNSDLILFLPSIYSAIILTRRLCFFRLYKFSWNPWVLTLKVLCTKINLFDEDVFVRQATFYSNDTVCLHVNNWNELSKKSDVRCKIQIGCQKTNNISFQDFWLLTFQADCLQVTSTPHQLTEMFVNRAEQTSPNWVRVTEVARMWGTKVCLAKFLKF